MLHWRRTRKYLKMCTQPARSLPEYLTDGILLKHLKNKGPTALTWLRIRQLMLLTKCEDSARLLVIIASNESSTSCTSGASAPIRAFMARAVIYDYGWDIGDIKGRYAAFPYQDIIALSIFVKAIQAKQSHSSTVEVLCIRSHIVWHSGLPVQSPSIQPKWGLHNTQGTCEGSQRENDSRMI